MKYIIVLLILLTCISCSSSFYTATFGNKNVYKTKSNLTVKKVYHDNRPSTDQREFTIVPNASIPVVTKTTISVVTEPANAANPSQVTTTTISATIPPSVTTTSSVIVAQVPPAIVKTTTSNSTYTIPPAIATNNYIRYKVVTDEGDNKYIQILPGCRFDGLSPIDTSIVFNSTGVTPADKPDDYIFQVSKKSLFPNTHYLASSALIGKVITLPVRVRNEYWNDNNKVLQGTLSIGYGFGWKYKLGNNPYKAHYFSTILYSAGISAQKHFSKAGKYVATGKDSISAKTDEFAVTYLSFGFAYEYDRFNIGLFFGKDRMFGNLKNWVYQDKWWWGIGIGYELFK
jgi:hypothetical protein